MVEHASCECRRQQTFCLNRARIELQRPLKKVDGLRVVGPRRPSGERGASPDNVVERAGVIDWARGFRENELKVERDCNPARDFIL